MIKIKRTTYRRQTVEPRASRIRRDPAMADRGQLLRRNAWWTSREWEIRLAVAGITFFALAISAVVIDLGEVFSH